VTGRRGPYRQSYTSQATAKNGTSVTAYVQSQARSTYAATTAPISHRIAASSSQRCLLTAQS